MEVGWRKLSWLEREEHIRNALLPCVGKAGEECGLCGKICDYSACHTKRIMGRIDRSWAVAYLHAREEYRACL